MKHICLLFVSFCVVNVCELCATLSSVENAFHKKISENLKGHENDIVRKCSYLNQIHTTLRLCLTAYMNGNFGDTIRGIAAYVNEIGKREKFNESFEALSEPHKVAVVYSFYFLSDFMICSPDDWIKKFTSNYKEDDEIKKFVSGLNDSKFARIKKIVDRYYRDDDAVACLKDLWSDFQRNLLLDGVYIEDKAMVVNAAIMLSASEYGSVFEPYRKVNKQAAINEIKKVNSSISIDAVGDSFDILSDNITSRRFLSNRKVLTNKDLVEKLGDLGVVIASARGAYGMYKELSVESSDFLCSLPCQTVASVERDLVTIKNVNKVFLDKNKPTDIELSLKNFLSERLRSSVDRLMKKFENGGNYSNDKIKKLEKVHNCESMLYNIKEEFQEIIERNERLENVVDLKGLEEEITKAEKAICEKLKEIKQKTVNNLINNIKANDGLYGKNKIAVLATKKDCLDMLYAINEEVESINEGQIKKIEIDLKEVNGLVQKAEKAICEKFKDIVNRGVDRLNNAVKDKNENLFTVAMNTYCCVENLQTIDENIKDMNRINNSLVKYCKESNISVEELELFAKRTKVTIYGIFLSALDKMIAARTEKIKSENNSFGEYKITDSQIANCCIPVLESIDADIKSANKMKTRLEENSEENKVDANEFEESCRKTKKVICEKLKKITERLVASLSDEIKNENGDYGTKKIGKLNSVEACISTLDSLYREIEAITKVNASFENKFNLEELENLVQKTNEGIYVKFRDFLQSAAVDLKKKFKDVGGVYSQKKIAALRDWNECLEMSCRITAELLDIKQYNYKLGKYAVDLSELLDLVEKAENAIREKEKRL